MTVTLYGSPMSLYTGRVRSYFIKAGLDFSERHPVSDHYEDVVLAKAGGRRSMPTVELDSGEVIRDSVAIVDHFEAELGTPFTPRTPRQSAVSLLFDVIGSEGMMRPAMHYRWRFPENERMVRFHFEEITPRNAPPQFTVAGRFERMKQACIDLGAPPERVDLVESLYGRLLGALDAHFAAAPYLLGQQTCIGDFGLIAPMYAHLGRDLKPLSLMHEHAPNVLRWVERMNRTEHNLGAHHSRTEGYFEGDDVPESLLSVLRQIAIDFVPETRAACDATNDWITAHADLAAGTEVARTIGNATFEVEGQSMTAAVQPFRFYLLKRLQDDVAGCSDLEQRDVIQILEEAHMSELLEMKLHRDIGRVGNLEVWL